ncbi:MAG: outer membrane cobalamin receptor [Oleiphilaceae bacterium]|jgi:iron complex outermembrane receptor protein
MNSLIKMTINKNNVHLQKANKYIILSAFLFANSSSYASDVNTQTMTALQKEIKWLQEETYVITATKTQENINKSGATVSVITAKDLKNMGARNLMDALKRLPGLGVNQMKMGMSAVEVRGVKTDFGEKVLFLMNGHPINNNLVNGGAHSSYNNFMIDDIKRVEVIRGPGSALYGANAFVAVINIITKDVSDIDGSKVTVGAGSYQSKKLNMQLGESYGQLDLTANLNIFDTDGFKGDVASDKNGNSGKSDYWNQRYDLGAQLAYGDYSLQAKYIKRQSGPFLGATNELNDESKQDYTDYFIELGYQTPLSNQLNFSSKLYFDHFQFDNLWEFIPDGFFVRSPVEHDKTGAELQLEYRFNDNHKFLGGIMAEHQSQYNVEFWSNGGTGPLQDISSFANWNGSHNRNIHAVYVQDIWDINETLRLIAGTRYDNYSDFGSSFNPRMSLSWEFTDNYSLSTSYGSAFRAPTFGELYNTNNTSIVGNPDIQPEEIETYEVGISGDISKKLNFKITGFHNNITDLIGAVPTTTAALESRNIGILEVDGVEMEFSSRLKGGSIMSLNYTYQNAVNELTDSRATDVPRQKLNASFNYRHSRFVNTYAGLNHRGRLSRADSDARSEIGSHTTLDIALNIKGPLDQWDITASIYNFFDKNYYDPTQAGTMISDYPKQGRSFNLEASYKL